MSLFGRSLTTHQPQHSVKMTLAWLSCICVSSSPTACRIFFLSTEDGRRRTRYFPFWLHQDSSLLLLSFLFIPMVFNFEKFMKVCVSGYQRLLPQLFHLLHTTYHHMLSSFSIRTTSPSLVLLSLHQLQIHSRNFPPSAAAQDTFLPLLSFFSKAQFYNSDEFGMPSLAVERDAVKLMSSWLYVSITASNQSTSTPPRFVCSTS